MTTVDGSNSIRDISASIDLGPSGSIQMLYAALQLAQAEICKGQAESYMEKIKATQEEQKECAKMIELARAKQSEADANGDCTYLDGELKAYFESKGLSWDKDGNDDKHNKEEWDYNIKSLTNYQEQLGTSTQTDMVYLQDFMGQYNSFLQGANKAVSDSNQTLQAIVTR